MPLCGTDYHERILDVEGVAPFGKRDCGDGCRRAEVPVLDSKVADMEGGSGSDAYLDGFIPTTRREDASRCVDPADDLYGRVVLRDLSGLACRDVKHPSSVVCATREDFVPLLYFRWR